jgi:oligopeptide/dipeptide ABC transporter ATP-binding protein
MQTQTKTILEVNSIAKSFIVREKKSFFKSEKKYLKAVKDVSFTLDEAECLVLVGESGCGKSTLAKLVCRLIDADRGEIIYQDRNINDLKSGELKEIRKDIQMVFQNPFSSLDPRFTIKQSLMEPLKLIKHPNPEARIKELLELVELTPEIIVKYPHQCSGGQNQRVCIARALALEPKVLIADEAVSALDVSIQWKILKLLDRLKRELNLSLLFITHDLAVTKYIADRISVMYLGEIVETAPKDILFNNPQHPYTRALLNAAPLPDPKLRDRERIYLEGEIPKPTAEIKACPFKTRCAHAEELCFQDKPLLKACTDSQEHLAACHFAE